MSTTHRKHHEHLQEERTGHTKYGKVDSTTHKGPEDDTPSVSNELASGKGPEPHPIAEKAYFSGATDSKRNKMNAVPSENQDPQAVESFENQHRPTHTPTNAPRPKPSSAPKPRPAGY